MTVKLRIRSRHMGSTLKCTTKETGILLLAGEDIWLWSRIQPGGWDAHMVANNTNKANGNKMWRAVVNARP